MLLAETLGKCAIACPRGERGEGAGRIHDEGEVTRGHAPIQKRTHAYLGGGDDGRVVGDDAAVGVAAEHGEEGGRGRGAHGGVPRVQVPVRLDGPHAPGHVRKHRGPPPFLVEERVCVAFLPVQAERHDDAGFFQVDHGPVPKVMLENVFLVLVAVLGPPRVDQPPRLVPENVRRGEHVDVVAFGGRVARGQQQRQDAPRTRARDQVHLVHEVGVAFHDAFHDAEVEHAPHPAPVQAEDAERPPPVHRVELFQAAVVGVGRVTFVDARGDAVHARPKRQARRPGQRVVAPINLHRPLAPQQLGQQGGGRDPGLPHQAANRQVPQFVHRNAGPCCARRI